MSRSGAAGSEGGPKLGRRGREGEVTGAGSALGDRLAVAGANPEPGIGEWGLLADTGDTGSPCNPQNLNQAPAQQSPALWAQPASCDTAARLLHRLRQSKFLVDLCCRKSLLQTLHADLLGHAGCPWQHYMTAASVLNPPSALITCLHSWTPTHVEVWCEKCTHPRRLKAHDRGSL